MGRHRFIYHTAILILSVSVANQFAALLRIDNLQWSDPVETQTLFRVDLGGTPAAALGGREYRGALPGSSSGWNRKVAGANTIKSSRPVNFLNRDKVL